MPFSLHAFGQIIALEQQSSVTYRFVMNEALKAFFPALAWSLVSPAVQIPISEAGIAFWRSCLSD